MLETKVETVELSQQYLHSYCNS